MSFVYEVDLKDGVSAEAKAAASAVMTLERALMSTANALTKANALGNVAQHNKLTTASTQLSTALQQERDKLAAVTGSAGGAQAALASVSGKSATATSGVSSLSGALEAVPWAAAAAAALAFAAGVVAVTVKLAAMTLEATAAKAKLTSMFDALGGGVSSGKAVVSLLDDLSGQVGMTREQLAPLARDIEAMGVRSLPALKAQLLATASATALMGEQGAGAYKELAAKLLGASQAGTKFKGGINDLSGQLAKMGLSVTDVAAALGISAQELGKQLATTGVDATKLGDALQSALAKKGKGALDSAATSFAFLKDQFTANIMHLFEDVNVKPFLDALKQVVNLFSQDTAMGRVLKSALTGTFNAIFSAAAKAIPYIIAGLLKMTIAVLRVALFFKPAAKAVSTLLDIVGRGTVLRAMAGMVLALVSPLIAVAVVVALAAAGVAGFLVVLAKIVVTGKRVLAAVLGLASGVGAAFARWASDAATAAGSLIDGLVSGIGAGVSRVVSAATGLASKVKGAISAALGIHSPSKVMIAMGGHTAEGFAQGVEQATPRVAEATGGMAMAAAGGAAGAKGGAGKGGGSMSVTIERIEISGAGKSAMQITEEMISTTFERIGLAAGYG